MNHIFYFDGNQKKISWIIENHQARTEQERVHAENFYDMVNTEQSKYIALHVGLFWGIGRFIIKNGDTIHVMIDNETMFEQLTKNKKSDDPFIESRIGFISQLINQRGLNTNYEMIEPKNNPASSLIS